MKKINSTLKFTIIILLICSTIELFNYQSTFPKSYESFNEAVHYSYLSIMHFVLFIIVYFVPTFLINYIIQHKITTS